MGATSDYALPYPANSDGPFGPAQIQALAEKTDDVIGIVDGLSCRSLADQTLTSQATVQTATSMGITVPVSTVYRLDGYLMYSSATGADIKFSFTIPTAATLSWALVGYDVGVGAGGIGSVNVNARNRDATTAISLGGINVGSEVGAVLSGLLVVSTTAGTLQLKFAQNASTASNTVLHRDSWMTLKKVV